jgi:PAS domain S-box-containing protein
VSPSGARRWPVYVVAIVTVAGATAILYTLRGTLGELTRASVLAGVVIAYLVWHHKREAPPAESPPRAAPVDVHEELARSERRFRQLMEHAAEAILIADADGVYTDVNEGACHLLGYARHELVGKRIVDILPPRDVPRLAAFRAKLGEGATQVAEWRLVRKDGSTVLVEISAKTLPCGLCQAIMRDVSARKQVEQDLIRAGMEAERLRQDAESARRAAESAREQAEAANRAKDHFLAVLSHELRTPLTPVVTGVQIVEADPDSSLSPDARETLAMIRRNVDLETRLIDDLLDITRMSRGKLRLDESIVDLHAKFLNVVAICDADIKGKRLALDLDLSARRHHARADAARLQQVFWNLLKNAIKFTPEGGRITVRTADGPGGRMALEVIDTGIGIEPAALERIFDAFEQGEKSIARQYGGLGLGLAISKALVALHGGTIRAHSEGLNRGAAFKVELPAFDAPADAAAAPFGGDDAPDADRRLSILVVEDHYDTAYALERLLRAAGHQVRTTDCVATALAAADAQEFDVLISDIGLPDGSGLDLMRQLLARKPPDAKPLKGIVLSGFGMEEDVRKSRQAGFVEHLTKPVNFARLRGTIEKIVARECDSPAEASSRS